MLALLAGCLFAQAFPHQEAIIPTVKRVGRSSNAQALSPDGKELAFNAEFHGLGRFPDDISVRFLSLATGKVRLSVPCPDSRIDSLAWSPEGDVVAVLANDGEVRITRPKDGSLEAAFPSSPDVVRPLSRPRSIDFVDGGTKLLLAGGRSAIQLCERKGGAVLAEFLLESEASISALCLSDDRLHFAAGDMAGSYAVYSARTGRLEAGPFSGPKPVNDLALAPDGEHIAAGLGDCKVHLVPLRAGARSIELSHCDQDLLGNLQIGSVAFSHDGKELLASSYSFYEVRLWNLETGAVKWHFHSSGGNESAITARFAANGSRIVVTSGDVADAATGEIRHALSPTRFTRLFSFEGSYAWTVSEEHLRVYDVRDGKLVADVDLREPLPR